MLQLRNTPDPDCKISPAQIVFGRPLRDSFAFLNRLEKFTNPAVQGRWRDAWKLKEEALRTRFTRTTEKLNENARLIPPLQIGDRCLVQNQYGQHPKKWDKSGKIVEIHPFNQYTVLIDGSRRLTKRNRKFLRKYTLPSTSLPCPAPVTKDPNCPITIPSQSHTRTITTKGNNTLDIPRISPNDPPPVDVLPPPCNDGEGGVSESIATQINPKPQPLLLRKLVDFNSPGLKEQHATPVQSRLRPRRK